MHGTPGPDPSYRCEQAFGSTKPQVGRNGASGHAPATRAPSPRDLLVGGVVAASTWVSPLTDATSLIGQPCFLPKPTAPTGALRPPPKDSYAERAWVLPLPIPACFPRRDAARCAHGPQLR